MGRLTPSVKLEEEKDNKAHSAGDWQALAKLLTLALLSLPGKATGGQGSFLRGPTHYQKLRKRFGNMQIIRMSLGIHMHFGPAKERNTKVIYSNDIFDHCEN